VIGDLTTAQIIIEDGAYFKGSIETEKSTEKEGDKNALSRRHPHRLRRRGRGAEEYLITKECLGSYAQDCGNMWFIEFGCSHLSSRGTGYMFPFFYAAR